MKTLKILGLLVISVNVLANQERGPRKPNPEVVALMQKACEGQTQVGGECSFDAPDGAKVSGTCQLPKKLKEDGTNPPLGCRPNKPRRQDNGQNGAEG